ncbi:MAG: hypothetical protein AAGA48_04415 [Myxococcota bacterium]
MLAFADTFKPSGCALVAYTDKGTPTPTFGSAGVQVVSDCPTEIGPRTGGYAMWQFDTLRGVLPDGGIDGAFSATVSAFEALAEVTLDPQGRLLLTGFSDGLTFTAQRLLPDGAVDTTFGTAGTLAVPVPPFGGNDAIGSDTVFDENGGGAILVETNVGSTIFEELPRILRFGPDGQVDAGFGAGGLAPILRESEVGFALGLVRTSTGRFVTVSWVFDGSFSGDAYVARFNPDGSADPTFGEGGRVPVELPRILIYDEAAERILTVGEQDSPTGGILVSRFWL